MWVYGDVERIEEPAAVRVSISEGLVAFEAQPPGLDRHVALVSAFIRSSELVQGLADAEFFARGFDARSPLQEIGARLLQVLSQAVIRSWRSDFRDGMLPEAVSALLPALDYPAPISTKRAEGYALYALYPENYIAAALASGLGPQTQVIGIRSIGTGLASLVAATLNADLPITVRPVGMPFERQLQPAPELTAEIAADPLRPFAVVDEGPGLSGSSFGAVADWLESVGVARERIHFFPSHTGDLGPEASLPHRVRWEQAPRHSVDIEQLLVKTERPAHRLEDWVSGIIGQLDRPMDDISGGGWRQIKHPDEGLWPPTDAQRGRRKFLARAGDVSWLVKFAAVGDEGLRKLGKARMLHEAGFSPEAAGMCHGFLIERWMYGTPLDLAQPADRPQLINTIGRYLGYRAKNLAAESGGATLKTLADMATYNAGQALGDGARLVLEDYFRRSGDLEAKVRRVDTDNRLHAFEWLLEADGRLIKTDALDHSAGHDLVGCQDIAWDVVGATVEHWLSSKETAQLCDTVAATSGRAVDPDLVALLTPCYLAFQLGLWTFAALSAGGADTERSAAMTRRYTQDLAVWLAPVTTPAF